MRRHNPHDLPPRRGHPLANNRDDKSLETKSPPDVNGWTDPDTDWEDREPRPDEWNEQAWLDFLDEDDVGEPEPEAGDFWWEGEDDDE